MTLSVRDASGQASSEQTCSRAGRSREPAGRPRPSRLSGCTREVAAPVTPFRWLTSRCQILTVLCSEWSSTAEWWFIRAIGGPSAETPREARLRSQPTLKAPDRMTRGSPHGTTTYYCPPEITGVIAARSAASACPREPLVQESPVSGLVPKRRRPPSGACPTRQKDSYCDQARLRPR